MMWHHPKLITKKFQRALWTAIFIGAAFGGANVQVSPSVQRGTTFAQTNCARCHSIDKVSPSSLSWPLRSAFCICGIRSES